MGEKVRFQTHFLHLGLEYTFNILSADFSPIQKIKEKINSDFPNVFIPLSLKNSQTNKEIEITFGVKPRFDRFEYYIRVLTQGEMREYHVFNGHTAFIFYITQLFSSYTYNVKSNTVFVFSKKRKVVFKCDLNEAGKIEVQTKGTDVSKVIEHYSSHSSNSILSYIPFEV